jgi:hypothetical protein
MSWLLSLVHAYQTLLLVKSLRTVTRSENNKKVKNCGTMWDEW